MGSQLQWQPKQVNENLFTRVAVLPTSLVWYQTIFTGIWFGCFESDHQVQEHPVTMLTKFDPGGFFSLHGHPGGEEILVLQGDFADETGVHPPGTYMLNPEGFIHRPYSERGCLTFVKLRQHGGKSRQQIKTNIYKSSWQSGIIPQIELQLLYKQTGYPEKVWVERWQPHTTLSNVVETRGCLTFVKLRQHGGKSRQQIKTNIYKSSWQSGIIPQIELQLLYKQTGYPEKVWVERWQPHTTLSNVVETEMKEIFVIEGIWQDELGSYPTGSWLRYPPHCAYSPRSETGCLIYVKTYPVDRTRFIVGEDFQHPPETLPFT
ncbi:hypothetical protein WN50_36075 [Limnoraphis robusta CS-951]|uniref:ChrR-like cupin domain-containing protein n=2 Tax=Limnoraphis TaxID=1332112 RepID=A0A0J9EYR0_9CYAN|nr:hypothetical protein WN50_36075 [Limnoraphis robusta CS-951]